MSLGFSAAVFFSPSTDASFGAVAAITSVTIATPGHIQTGNEPTATAIRVHLCLFQLDRSDSKPAFLGSASGVFWLGTGSFHPGSALGVFWLDSSFFQLGSAGLFH
jgi:hypothetical protein